MGGFEFEAENGVPGVERGSLNVLFLCVVEHLKTRPVGEGLTLGEVRDCLEELNLTGHGEV